MKSLLYFFIVILVVIYFSSCASIFSARTTTVKVHTKDPVSLIHDNRVYYSVPKQPYYNEYTVRFDPIRSKDSLKFSIQNEHDTAHFEYKSIINPTIFLNIFTYGIGFIPDLLSKKRYSYPQNINLTKENIPILSDQYYPGKQPSSRKGMIVLDLGFPTFNFVNTYSNFDKSHHNDFALFGISLGADYYYHHNSYFNFATGLTSTLDGFYMDRDWEGNWYFVQSLYTSLTHNHRIYNSLSFGYGLSYGINWWQYQSRESKYNKDNYHGNTTFETTEKRDVLGLMFHARYILGEKVYLGVDYRPSFFRFQSKDKFEYEHLISLTFGLKIRLKKGK